jgi:serine/threonine protein kinase
VCVCDGGPSPVVAFPSPGPHPTLAADCFPPPQPLRPFSLPAQALRRLSPHPNIVKLHEVLYDQPTGRLALVFELMDCNIYELIKGRTHYLPEETVKIYMYQLMKAVDHMHRHGIFHR